MTETLLPPRELRPIETAYRGYRFRSRLEARWAVYFDALGVPWSYEPQGYRLPAGYYLPDFAFPGWRAFGEVKPTVAAVNWTLLEQLADASGCPVVALVGTPDLAWYECALRRPAWFGGDPLREWVDLGRSALCDRLWYGAVGERPPAHLLDERLAAFLATHAARGARFEHGECPLR